MQSIFTNSVLPNPLAEGFSNLAVVLSRFSLYRENGLLVEASCAKVSVSPFFPLCENENVSPLSLLELVSHGLGEVTPDMAKICGVNGWPFPTRVWRLK